MDASGICLTVWTSKHWSWNGEDVTIILFGRLDFQKMDTFLCQLDIVSARLAHGTTAEEFDPNWRLLLLQVSSTVC
jgi:hypothetical protein